MWNIKLVKKSQVKERLKYLQKNIKKSIYVIILYYNIEKFNFSIKETELLKFNYFFIFFYSLHKICKNFLAKLKKSANLYFEKGFYFINQKKYFNLVLNLFYFKLLASENQCISELTCFSFINNSWIHFTIKTTHLSTQKSTICKLNLRPYFFPLDLTCYYFTRE